MFTGLIQDVGTLRAVVRHSTDAKFTIATTLDVQQLGESISVMGACLSVTEHTTGLFTAFASAETLDKTNLTQLGNGAKVNLERALQVGDPLGGHLVAGHVDALVPVLERRSVGGAEQFTIGMPDEGELQRQIAPKGSVALNGVSLTVNNVHADRFELMVIPITLQETTLGVSRPGDKINLETDLLAKYVGRHLRAEPGNQDGVDLALLVKSGFAR